MGRSSSSLALLAVLVAGTSTTRAQEDARSPLSLGPLRLPAALALAVDAVEVTVSTKRVSTTWEIRAGAGRDVGAVLVQSLPDLSPTLSGLDDLAARKVGPDLLGVTIEVDGKRIEPEAAVRASAAGLDVTARLEADGLPVDPWIVADMEGRLAALPADRRAFYVERGMVDWPQSGPAVWGWTASTALWWRQTFSGGKPARTVVSFVPVTGETLLTEPSLRRLAESDRCRGPASAAALGKAAAALKEAARGETATAFLDRRVDLAFQSGPDAPVLGRFALKIEPPTAATLVVVCGGAIASTAGEPLSLAATNLEPPASIEVHFIEPPQKPK